MSLRKLALAPHCVVVILPCCSWPLWLRLGVGSLPLVGGPLLVLCFTFVLKLVFLFLYNLGVFSLAALHRWANMVGLAAANLVPHFKRLLPPQQIDGRSTLLFRDNEEPSVWYPYEKLWPVARAGTCIYLINALPPPSPESLVVRSNLPPSDGTELGASSPSTCSATWSCTRPSCLPTCSPWFLHPWYFGWPWPGDRGVDPPFCAGLGEAFATLFGAKGAALPDLAGLVRPREAAFPDLYALLGWCASGSASWGLRGLWFGLVQNWN